MGNGDRSTRHTRAETARRTTLGERGEESAPGVGQPPVAGLSTQDDLAGIIEAKGIEQRAREPKAAEPKAAEPKAAAPKARSAAAKAGALPIAALETYDDVLGAILARTNVEAIAPGVVDKASVFQLERMRALAHALGDPHLAYATVHVAGSKGKGSVCEMSAAALQACGCTVGLYTSPHLVDIRERVRINQREIEREEFAAIGKRVLEASAKLPKKLGEVTTFEALTAIALVWFEEQAVDLAVIETGLGGLGDATNIVQPLVAAVTAIQLEHTALLGETLEAIAAHKAGIYKNGAAALTIEQGEPVLAVLREAATTAGVTLEVVGPSPLEYSARLGGSAELGPHYKVSLATPTSVFEHVPVPLKGEPQAMNCGLVLAILDKLRARGMELPDARIAEGLARTPARGRLELVHDGPRIIVDGAHTPESLSATIKAVGAQMRYDSLVVVFGCCADKDIAGCLQAVAMGADKIILTRACGNARAAEPKELLKRLGDGANKAQAAPCVKDALNLAARAIGRGDLILVTGSFAVAGEAKKLLLEKQKGGRA